MCLFAKGPNPITHLGHGLGVYRNSKNKAVFILMTESLVLGQVVSSVCSPFKNRELLVSLTPYLTGKLSAATNNKPTFLE